MTETALSGAFLCRFLKGCMRALQLGRSGSWGLGCVSPFFVFTTRFICITTPFITKFRWVKYHNPYSLVWLLCDVIRGASISEGISCGRCVNGVSPAQHKRSRTDCHKVRCSRCRHDIDSSFSLRSNFLFSSSTTSRDSCQRAMIETRSSCSRRVDLGTRLLQADLTHIRNWPRMASSSLCIYNGAASSARRITLRTLVFARDTYCGQNYACFRRIEKMLNASDMFP